MLRNILVTNPCIYSALEKPDRATEKKNEMSKENYQSVNFIQLTAFKAYIGTIHNTRMICFCKNGLL